MNSEKETERPENKRLAELEDEFKKGGTLIKQLQEEIAERQRKIAAVRETQLRIQGAYAELNKKKE